LRGEGEGGFLKGELPSKKTKKRKGVMEMEQDTKQERKPEGSQAEEPVAQGWKVSDEEIDRVIRKLEEGWGF